MRRFIYRERHYSRERKKKTHKAVYGSGEGDSESSTSSCHKAEVIFQQSPEDLTRKGKGL